MLRNAAQNQAAGRPLTANQQRAIRAQAVPLPRPAVVTQRPARDRNRSTPPRPGKLAHKRKCYGMQQQNVAAGRPLTQNQQQAIRAQAVPLPRPAVTAPRPAPRPQATYTTRTGQTRTAGRCCAMLPRTLQLVGRSPQTSSRLYGHRPGLHPGQHLGHLRHRLGRPRPAPTYTTKTGQTRTQAQVLRNAAQNQAAGRPLTANQQRAVRQQQVAPPPRPAPRAPAPAPRPAPTGLLQPRPTRPGQGRPGRRRKSFKTPGRTSPLVGR